MPVDNSVIFSDQFLSAIKQEYRILAEYKMIQSETISGVFVIPSATSSLIWFGVIFVRIGTYQDAIFRFKIKLSPSFPDNETPVRLILLHNLCI